MKLNVLRGLCTALSLIAFGFGWMAAEGWSQDDLIESSATLASVKDGIPILAIQASGGGNLISAGTADGKTHYWRYYTAPPIPLEPPAVDPVATLVLGGKSRALVRAGFDPSPSITLLPGKYLGNLDIGANKARAVATRIHGDQQWIAIRFDDHVEIRTRGMQAGQQPMQLPGTYQHIAWSTGEGTSLLLIAARAPTADGFAELHAWSIGGASAPSAEVVVFPPAQTATATTITSLATVEGDQTLVTGDSAGGIRWWRTGQRVADSLPFGPDTKALVSEAADALLLHRAAKLHLLNPLKLDPVGANVAIDTRDAKPILLAHHSAASPTPGKHFASMVWPEQSAKYDLQIFEFGKPAATLTESIGNRPIALALHPSGKQLAVATKEDGAVFFPSPAPAPPPAPGDPEFDNSILLLRYSNSGDRLYAVGKSISVYDALTGKLLGSAPLPLSAVSDKPVACEFELDHQDAGAAQPPRGRILLATSSGRLQLWSVVFNGAGANEPTPQKLQDVNSGKLDNLELHGELAIAGAGQMATLWRVAGNGFSALEHFRVNEPLIGAELTTDGASFIAITDRVIQRGVHSLAATQMGNQEITQLSAAKDRLAACGTAPAKISLLKDGKLLDEVNSNAPASALSLHPEGKRLLVGTQDGVWFSYQIDSNNQFLPPVARGVPGSPVRVLGHALEGNSIFLGRQEGTIGQYSIDDQQALSTLLELPKSVADLTSIAHLPGRLLVTSPAGELSIRTLDLLEGPKLATPTSPPNGAPLWYSMHLEQSGANIFLTGANATIARWTYSPTSSIDSKLDPVITPLSGENIAPLNQESRPKITSPLYAIAGLAGDPSVIMVGGFDGVLHRGKLTATPLWEEFTTPHADTAIYAIASHPSKSVVALGCVKRIVSSSPEIADGQSFLTLFPKSLQSTSAVNWLQEPSTLVGVEFSPSGKRMAAVFGSSQVYVWNTAHLTEDHVSPGPIADSVAIATGRPKCLAWIGETQFIVGDSSGAITLVKIR